MGLAEHIVPEVEGFEDTRPALLDLTGLVTIVEGKHTVHNSRRTKNNVVLHRSMYMVSQLQLLNVM
jgi:hypothetical protein